MKKSFFLIAFLLLGLTTIGFSQDKDSKKSTRSFDLEAFDGIELKISADINLTQGAQSVSISGKEKAFEKLDLSVKNGILVIGAKNKAKNIPRLQIDIAMETVSMLKVFGDGNIIGEGAFSGLDKLKLDVFGSGDIEVEANCQKLLCDIFGSGDIRVSGSANSSEISISGSGDQQSYGLQTQKTKITIYGSGSCEVHANESLDVNLTGSGNVHYKGSPTVSKKILGSGELVSMN